MTTVPLPLPLFYIIVSNFDHYQVNEYVFKSDPFYSHPGGYKMLTIIRPNGSGERQGTHVSLFVHIFPGEFDDQLRWPLNLMAGSQYRHTTALQRSGHLNEQL